MSHRVFKDPYISLGAVDLSDHVAECRLDYTAEAPDDTASGDNTRSRLAGGLKDWTLTITFFQDLAAGEVDATLFSLVGTSVAVEVRSSTAAVGATNPKYTGNAILTNYQPAGGSIGEAQRAPVTLQGTGDLTRATA